MESLMSLNMITFRARLPERRQLKVHLNHRKFHQAKQTERLDQNGNGISYEARTVKFSPFTHQASPVDSTRLQERKTDHGNGVTHKRLSSLVDTMSREPPARSCEQDSPRSQRLWES